MAVFFPPLSLMSTFSHLSFFTDPSPASPKIPSFTLPLHLLHSPPSLSPHLRFTWRHANTSSSSFSSTSTQPLRTSHNMNNALYSEVLFSPALAEVTMCVRVRVSVCVSLGLILF